MADPEAAAAAAGDGAAESDERGRAYKVGWWCFLAFVALTPLVIGNLPPAVGSLSLFRAYDPVNLPKAVVLFVLTGLSLTALCVSVIRGESELRWHPVLWAVVALFGWAVVSAVFSTSLALSIWGASDRNEGLAAIFGYGLVAFLAIQYVRSTRDLRAVTVAAVVSGSLVSAYGLLQFFGIDVFDWVDWTGRVMSSFGNADMLGNYLVFPFALSLGLALSSRGKRLALVWWSTTVLIAAVLFMSYTRGAWIGAAVALVCMVFAGWHGVWSTSRRRKLAFGGFVAVAIVVTATLIIYRPGFGGPAVLAQGLARASNGRTVIWLTGLRGWLARPITGWGPDGFGRAFDSAVGADWYALIAGATMVDNAHNVFVQVLVTLGVPGLLLTVGVLTATAIRSFHSLRAAEGRTRWLLVAPWGALIGMSVALFFGVTCPEVSAWLWLTVGLLLAPTARKVAAPQRVALMASAALGVTLALWAGSWLVADVAAGRAMKLEVGPARVSGIESAIRINPMAQSYRVLLADSLVDQALAEQRGGSSRKTVNDTMLEAGAAYEAAVLADRGDVLARTGLADYLIGFAKAYPQSDASQRAVRTAQDAVALAPGNAVALVTLARAYEAAGRLDDAEKAAQLARSVAPAYSMQTLDPLGLGGTAPP